MDFQKYEFVGARGGAGTTTVAMITAALFAERYPTVPIRIAGDDMAFTALTGGGYTQIEYAPPSEADIIDAGSLNYPHFANTWAPGKRIVVLRGPDYIGLRTMVQHNVRESCAGVILVAEPGRSLNVDDVENSVGLPVFATIPHDVAIARMTDAGLLLGRITKSASIVGYREWLFDVRVDA